MPEAECMNRLYIIYDAKCALCRACRVWLGGQPSYFELRFLPMQAPETRLKFPELVRHGLGEDLIAVTEEGGVYRGADAWIICLYALSEYREWSYRLATPAMMPLAKRFFILLSERRHKFSRWLLGASEVDLAREIEDAETAGCTTGACGVRPLANWGAE